MGAIEKWQAESILRYKWAVAAWLVVNLMDSVLTFALLRMGAEEAWLVYRVTDNIYWATVAKWCGVALVAGMLVWMNRLRWLRWFTLGIGLVVLWNLVALVWLGLIHPAP